ncbi:hypothetical protein [Vibrio algarum]|uniref:Uncharacterized protein n=1 Tax=Vibrio algarum TaxID=3020714 RepID=A0ABT4YU90_9VIBR|nr:hypothetical protein [Vibrio sp. KJ40-1]MDB1125116.1 hypothetical protein [Vibrio sp. KJ40-1]
MLLINHYWKVLLELMMLFGVMVFAMVTVQQFSGSTTVTLESVWTLALLAGAVGFRFESFINFHKLDERSMSINYFISSVLADITLITLLIKFTPGGEQFAGKGWAILGVYTILKMAFYVVMHFISLNNARIINVALKKGRSEL